MSGSVGLPLPLTTRGDTIVADSSGAPVRLPVGANGRVRKAREVSRGGAVDESWVDPIEIDIRDFVYYSNRLQGAVDQLPSNGGRVRLYGTTTLTSQVTWTKTAVEIVGANGAKLEHDAGSDALIKIPRLGRRAVISNLEITRPSGGTSTGDGILVQGDSVGGQGEGFFSQMWIHALGGLGIRCEDAYNNLFERVYCQLNLGGGMWMGAASGAYGCAVNSLVQCSFRENTGTGLELSNASRTSIVGLYSESNFGWGLVVGSATPKLHAAGAHFENNDRSGGTGSIQLAGALNTFEAVYSDSKDIDISGSHNVFIGSDIPIVTIDAGANHNRFLGCLESIFTDNSGTAVRIAKTVAGGNMTTIMPGTLNLGTPSTGPVSVKGALSVDGSTTLGDASSDGLTVNATSTIKASAAFYDNSYGMKWQAAGVDAWFAYMAGGTQFQIRDLVNARAHLQFTPGASDAAASTIMSSGLNVKGPLDHDGTTVGFFGVTPAARPTTYAATNVTTDRSYDANATTLDEIADVLGTLIADLRSLGLVT